MHAINSRSVIREGGICWLVSRAVVIHFINKNVLAAIRVVVRAAVATGGAI